MVSNHDLHVATPALSWGFMTSEVKSLSGNDDEKNHDSSIQLLTNRIIPKLTFFNQTN